jgi:hypothetical protein
MFQLYVNPASVEVEKEKYLHYFPGKQEAEIEKTLIELAARDDGSFFDGKKLAFTLSRSHRCRANFRERKRL